MVPETSEYINLFEYWAIIKKSKRFIITIVLYFSLFGIIVSFVLPKTYQAKAVIMPVSSGRGGMSMIVSQLGALGSLPGLSGLKSGDDLTKLIAILKSRTLAENVIKERDLMQILFKKQWGFKIKQWKYPNKPPTMEKAVIAMGKKMLFVENKREKILMIKGEFDNPILAANLVNTYIDELQKFITANTFTTAKRNRVFIEDQLEDNKIDLLESGKEINEFYRRNQVSNAESELDVSIDMKSGVNVEPNSNDFQVEIPGLLSQKADLEKKISEAKVVKNVPQQVYLTYQLMRRELLAKINALLTTQYEMAKIEEAKEDLSFQVIDKAVPPEKKFKPKRKQICMMSFIAGLFLSLTIVFSKEYLQKMKTMTNSRI